MVSLGLLVLAFAAAGDSGGSDKLQLICYGEGSKPQMEIKSGYAYDWKQHKTAFQTRSELTTKEFEAQVLVEIAGDRSSIRLPKKLIPPINSGGSSGWWDLQNVRTDRDEITATFKLNGFNKPNLLIDRRTGRISIKGMSAFRGHCQSNEDDGRRKF